MNLVADALPYSWFSLLLVLLALFVKELVDMLKIKFKRRD